MTEFSEPGPASMADEAVLEGGHGEAATPPAPIMAPRPGIVPSAEPAVPAADPPATAWPSFGEFVGIIALMMGVISMSIDSMLPAFGPIGTALRVPDPNDLQLVLTVYMAGFALMQMVYGPVSDAIGRKPVLMIGLAILTVGSLFAIMAQSFPQLLAARAVQGMGAAAARVLAVAVVRDRYRGSEMARVMSLTMMVFLIVPVLAPAFGSLLLHLGSWRYVFAGMFVPAFGTALWYGLRMPESLHPQYRLPLEPARIWAAVRLCVTCRTAMGYATAMALMQGALMGYLGSSQPVFESQVYRLGDWFPAAFASFAGAMAVAAFLNARLVRRFGMQRLAHFGMIGFAVASAAMVTASAVWHGHPPLLVFGALLALAQCLFSLSVPNFNSIAMEPLGEVAGTASSFIGLYTTLMGALIGLYVGWAFDGSVHPLTLGYAVLGGLTLLVVLWTERGRLFPAIASRAA